MVMKELKNQQEKQLIIVRRIIADKIDPTDENIISTWCNLFPEDKYKLNDMEDTELFDKIRKFIRGNNIKSCNVQLARLRRKGERNLKSKGNRIGYRAKLVKESKNYLAKYDIFTKGKKYSGNYNALCQKLGVLTRERLRVKYSEIKG